MPLTETLRYLVTADSSGMVKELGKAQRSLKDTGDSADKAANRNEKAARETVQSWEKTSSRMKSVGRGLAAGIAGIGVFALVKDAAAEAREAAMMERDTAQVIKTTGGIANVTAKQVDQLADKYGKLAAVDDELVAQGANLLLTFTNVRNEMGKGNKIFDDGLRLGVDMAARFRMDLNPAIMMLGKALNDPLKGMTALSKKGVSFTQEQKDMVKALVESGDVLGAQKVILGELEKEVGGAAAAMADPMARFSVAVDDAKESVGEALLPVLEELASKAADLGDWFSGLDISTRKWAIGLGAAAAGAVALAGPVSSLVGLFKSLAATSAVTALGGLGPAAAVAAIALVNLKDAFTLIGRVQDESTSLTEDFGNSLQSVSAQLAIMVGLGGSAALDLKKLGGEVTDNEERARKLAAAWAETRIDEIVSNVDALALSFAASKDPVAAMAQTLGIMNTELDGTSDFAKEAADAIGAFFAPFLGREEALNAFDQGLRNIYTQMGVLTDGAPDTAEQLAAVGDAALGFTGDFATAAAKVVEFGGTAADVESLRTRAIAALTELGTHLSGPLREQNQRAIDKLVEFDSIDAVATANVAGNAEQQLRDIGNEMDTLIAKLGFNPNDFLSRVFRSISGAPGAGVLGRAEGGLLPKYRAGSGGGLFDQWTAVIGEGEGPEYVIPTEPRYRTRAIGLMTDASRALGISGLRSGGILDPIVGAFGGQEGERAVQAGQALLEMLKKYGGGKGRQAAEFARKQVGKPYVWGASGPNAFDCSGLTMASWASAGVGIPRVSHAQIAAARAMSMGEATGTPGALFYTQSSGSPSGGHIAISHGDGSLTNARGRATGVTITGPFGGRQGIPSFDRGGTLHPGLNVVHNGTGGPERLNSGPTVTVQIVNNGSIGVDDIVERVHRGLLDKQRRVGQLGLR
jgi:hypothetical protein